MCGGREWCTAGRNGFPAILIPTTMPTCFSALLKVAGFLGVWGGSARCVFTCQADGYVYLFIYKIILTSNFQIVVCPGALKIFLLDNSRVEGQDRGRLEQMMSVGRNGGQKRMHRVDKMDREGNSEKGKTANFEG